MALNGINRSAGVGNAGSVHAQNRINSYRNGGVDFASVLQKKVDKEFKFSAHAESRMKSRDINLSSEMMNKLQDAVEGAEKKGAKDTLVLMSDLAFIVNVPNKTVVTAMDGENIRDNVFTNIDSTVIAG